MKQNVGLLTALAAVLAVFGITYLPRMGSQGSAQQEAKTKASAPAHNKAQQTRIPDPCRGIIDHISRLVANPDVPDSCKRERKQPVGHASDCVKFAIATAPDPITTHLQLMFDRNLEAMMQAAQDEGYSYDGSWLPWEENPAEYAQFVDQLLSREWREAQLEQPGVLVFRRGPSSACPEPYSRGLIVFVVGEEPTGGISDTQFQNGLDWISRLRVAKHDEPLPILGPTFSGSLLSLARNLTAKGKEKSVQKLGQFRVASGSVSSEPNYRWFKRFLCEQELGEFQTFLESDEVMLDRFLDYLERQGYHKDRVAYVSEDETAFGFDETPTVVSAASAASAGGSACGPASRQTQCSGPNCTRADSAKTGTSGKQAKARPSRSVSGRGSSGSPCPQSRCAPEPGAGDANASQQGAKGQSVPRRCFLNVLCGEPSSKLPDSGPTYLYYPRDISSLRLAYEQQSIFSAGKQSGNQGGPSTTLRGNVNEPEGTEHDTVRTYAGQLTPLAEEAVLLAMADVLAAKRIEFVVIRSTNTLDQLFLAQFLKRAYPSGRVVIDDADLLFRRGAEGSALRGAMTLSTYPLLTQAQSWTATLRAQPNGSFRTFGEDVSEGVYIATRSALNPGRRGGVPIHDYSPPGWLADWKWYRASHPPIWLSVIGHREFWPVAVLEPDPPGTNHKHSILPDLPYFGDSRGNVGEDEPLTIPGQMTFLLCLCAVWAGWHLACCSSGSYFGSSRVLSAFAPVPRKGHRQLVFLGSALLVIAAILLPGHCGLGSSAMALWRQGIIGLWSAWMLSAALEGCHANYALPPLRAKVSQKDLDPTFRHGIAALCFLVLMVLTAWYVIWSLACKLTPENSVPLFWRSLHPLSGVSPLLPQLLLLAGLYVWFWFNLRGAAMFAIDRPLLPNQADLGTMPPIFSRGWVRENIEKGLRALGWPYLKAFGIAFLAAWAVFGMSLHGIAVRSLGERPFGILIFFSVCVCIAIVLADTFQLLRAWLRLRELLLYLDLLPVRRTLSSLKGLAWGSLWKMSGNVIEERWRVLSRQAESMLHLANALSRQDPKEGQAGQGFATVVAKLKTTLALLTSLRESYGKGFQVAGPAVFQQAGLMHRILNYLKTPITGRGAAISLEGLRDFQRGMAACAGAVLVEVLIPAWRVETDSLILAERGGAEPGSESRSTGKEPGGLSPWNIPAVNVTRAELPALRIGPIDIEPAAARPNFMRAAEEFFVLPYLAFIRNILGRMRTIVLGSLCLFLATTLAVSSYPFDPLPVLGGLFLGVFLITGCVVVYVYAGMHRDATLSYITNTRPGELGGEFWLQVLAFGIGPLAGLLTTLFPSLTDFIAGWVQPSASAIK